MDGVASHSEDFGTANTDGQSPMVGHEAKSATAFARFSAAQIEDDRDAAIAFLEPLGPYAALVVGTLVGVLIATLHLVLANPHILGDAAALEEESADGDGSERERDFAGAAGDDGGDGIELSQRVDRGGGTLSYPVATTFVVTEEEAGAGGGSASGVAALGPDDGGTIPWGDVDEDDGDDGFGEFAEAPPPPRAQGATAFLD